MQNFLCHFIGFFAIPKIKYHTKYHTKKYKYAMYEGDHESPLPSLIASLIGKAPGIREKLPGDPLASDRPRSGDMSATVSLPLRGKMVTLCYSLVMILDGSARFSPGFSHVLCDMCV